MHRAYVMTSAAVFAGVALVHVVRAANGWPVTIGEAVIPMWTSWAAVGVATAMAIWGLTSIRR